MRPAAFSPCAHVRVDLVCVEGAAGRRFVGADARIGEPGRTCSGWGDHQGLVELVEQALAAAVAPRGGDEIGAGPGSARAWARSLSARCARRATTAQDLQRLELRRASCSGGLQHPRQPTPCSRGSSPITRTRRSTAPAPRRPASSSWPARGHRRQFVIEALTRWSTPCSARTAGRTRRGRRARGEAGQRVLSGPSSRSAGGLGPP